MSSSKVRLNLHQESFWTHVISAHMKKNRHSASWMESIAQSCQLISIWILSPQKISLNPTVESTASLSQLTANLTLPSSITSQWLWSSAWFQMDQMLVSNQSRMIAWKNSLKALRKLRRFNSMLTSPNTVNALMYNRLHWLRTTIRATLMKTKRSWDSLAPYSILHSVSRIIHTEETTKIPIVFSRLSAQLSRRDQLDALKLVSWMSMMIKWRISPLMNTNFPSNSDSLTQLRVL